MNKIKSRQTCCVPFQTALSKVVLPAKWSYQYANNDNANIMIFSKFNVSKKIVNSFTFCFGLDTHADMLTQQLQW